MNKESSVLLASARAAIGEGERNKARQILGGLAGRPGLTHGQWIEIGELCRQAGDLGGAESALTRAIDMAPDEARARVILAALLREAGRPAEAVDQLQVACDMEPLEPRAAHLMGLMHLDQGLVRGAREWLSRARAAGADSAELDADLGLAAQAAGDLEEAESCYRLALAREPGHTRALRGMARLARIRRRPTEGLAFLESLGGELQNGGLLSELGGLLAAAGRSSEAIDLLEARLPELATDEDRMEVDFRLSELYDAAGDCGAAMTCLVRANRQKQSEFDPAHYASLVDRLLAVFGPDAFARTPAASHGDERPVFIVGMPRSGTSLVEQILASHREIHGAGELPDLGLLALSTARGGAEYPESVVGLAPEEVERLAAGYRARLDEIAPDARRVTDKMWQNFEFLGFGALLFPRARVIHCTRDPLDTGLSCYFQHFYGTGVAFAYDLSHIGAYYRQYRRIMGHWQDILPLPILEVSYERLVADAEGESRRMVDFCGLSWDPSCLRFFETERVIGTASHDQVRRPIYRTSVGRHRRYRRWLEPLARSLRDEVPDAG